MLKKLRKFLILGICANVLISESRIWAAEQYEYPELSVVPRASDRLHSEAEKEKNGKGGGLFPIQISGLSTLVAGVAVFRPNQPMAGYVGIGTGAFWLATTLVVGMTYHPYQSSLEEVSPMPKGTTREQLARERAAEEGLKNAAKFGEKLRWVSVFTNFGSSVFMLANASGDDWASTMQKNMAPTFAAISAGFSLLPLFFRPYWQDVHDQQLDYKKRIYAPVASGTLLFDSGSQRFLPGLVVSLRF